MRSEWYQERWGHLFTLPTATAEGDFKNLQGGTRFSTSIKGKAIGRHATRFMVDDAIKPTDVGKVALEVCEAWWKNTVPRAILKGGARVIIAQRLHDRDLPGIAIAQGFTLLRLPMEYESKYPCKTKWGGDRRTEDGELLWPEVFDKNRVAEKKRDAGSVNYAAQYQQRPVPEGGAVFNAEWFRHWTNKATVNVPGSREVTIPAKFDRVVLSVDAAFKDAATSDYVVIQVWAKKGPNFYLLYQVRERMGFEATCAAILRVCKLFPMATTKLIEEAANGAAIIDVLRKKVSGIVAVKPLGGKEARAQAVAPVHESGNVYDPDPSVTPWVAEMRAELCSFPFGAHDDTVDARSQALTYLLRAGTGFAEAMVAAQKRGSFLGYSLPQVDAPFVPRVFKI
jgi:predicted phage terminase large subunit-like protein